jgi:hypothetical protein
MSVAANSIKYVHQSSAIKECMRQGLINYSALARQITGKDRASYHASLMALSRYGKRLSRQNSNESKLIELVKASRMTIQNEMLVAEIPSSAPSDKFISLYSVIKQRGDEITIIGGQRYITLIVENTYGKELRSIFGKQLEVVVENTVQIRLRINNKTMKIKGLASYILNVIAAANVNIIEAVTCADEYIILVEGKDLAATMQALKG